MINIRFSTILIFAALACEPLIAQSLPSCRSIASDADGDGYGWENGNSCIVTNTTLVAPTFTNLETGNPVNLIRARWNQSDFVDFDIACKRFQFDGATYKATDAETLYIFQPLSQTAPNNGNVEINQLFTQTWTLDNGIYYGPSDLAISPWVEIIDHQTGVISGGAINTDNAVRVWLTNNTFARCRTTPYFGLFVPTGVPAQNATDTTLTSSVDNCDYSNAAIYDGWGWDAVSGTSCPPLDTSANNCDYSNAAMHNGWGWDAITGQSCAPVASTNTDTDQNCDYTNSLANNGWGWNPVTLLSCPPL